MDVVDTQVQIIENVLRFDAYRTSSRFEERSFYANRLRLGKIFVSMPFNGRTLFCPSRFAGYKNNTIEKHIAFENKDGRITTPQINAVLCFHPSSNNIEEIKYRDLCNEIGVGPSQKSRTYWVVGMQV